MNQRPVGNRILIRPDIPEEVTKGGIFIADIAKEKSITGTVVSIGNEKENKFEVRPGNKVRFGKYAGTEIQDKNQEILLVMREEDIFTIIS